MKKKIAKSISIPEFSDTIDILPLHEKIFSDKSMEIARHIFELMQQHGILQKDLAMKMNKTEAEVSRLLSGLHNYTLRSLTKVEAALGYEVISVPKLSTTIPMIHYTKTTDEFNENETASENQGVRTEEQMSWAA